MRIVKRILVVLLVLIIVIAVAGLFMKKDYAVEREIVINKPAQEVFDYLKMLKNQGEFSVWEKRDPKIKKTYIGTDGTIGFISGWESKMDEVGVGEQEIKTISDGKRIDTELRFKKPFEATDNAYFTTDMVSENQTKVKWGFNGTMPYPMNIMLPIMGMEDMLGGDLEEGLKNLKEVMEKK